MKRDNLGFGCVSLTSHLFLRNALAILSEAFQQGITHFDTAPLYGNGYSERILGRFIRNKREQVTITTKCGLGNADQPSLGISQALFLNAIKNRLKKNYTNNPGGRPALLQYRLITAKQVKASLEKSLKNLDTDYIDYYLLHEAMPSFLEDEAHSFLQAQLDNGRIKQLGIAAAYVNLENAAEVDLKDFSLLQYENGPRFNSDNIIKKFPSRRHIYHSALRALPDMNSDYPKQDWTGIILNRACRINPEGKVLFSTTSRERVIENIRSFDRFVDLPLQQLNNMIDGVH